MKRAGFQFFSDTLYRYGMVYRNRNRKNNL